MRGSIFALALLSAACAQPVATPTASGGLAAVRGCQAAASAPWRPVEGLNLSVEADSTGPDCRHAVALLTIRAPDGTVLWTDAHVAEHVMVLADANELGAMQAALGEWVAPGNAQSTAELPAWPAAADAPGGEFPFLPEPEVTRAAYEAARLQGMPMYCYVQGMESMTCLTWADGALTKLGVQLFPG